MYIASWERQALEMLDSCDVDAWMSGLNEKTIAECVYEISTNELTVHILTNDNSISQWYICEGRS